MLALTAVGVPIILAVVIVVPLMFAAGYALQWRCSIARSAATSCRRC